MEERCHPLTRKSWPKSFSGPIGQQLTCCEKLPVVDYVPIECSIPGIDRNLLSKDQQYLLDNSNAITLGHCPEDLANRDSGPLSHFRWLTAVNRVLRLYLSSKDPSGNLKEIVGFILKFYMPVWFAIKKSNYFTDGSKHVFQAIQTSPYLSDELLQVVDPVSFQASDCIEIINWNSCVVYPPPMLRDPSEDEIKSLINSDTTPIREIQKFPCHTQVVERCVKPVTEASNKVCGHEARDGYIRATLNRYAMIGYA
ncbi:hypothetical protein AVEN_194578-1 [Araneus ventricosus]|uniref:Uncharacterized protein n=1 Tax=Araneus ventricosus TaxID=182803 RepID=A0A4Y2A6M1_ARAVE|nr:hypothetical protein AVEN_194578-1 [Araneus ventricosus]